MTRYLLIGLLYVSLTVLLTWPTAAHLSTHVPGDGGDDPAIAWNLWWVKHALLTEGQTPFHTDYMFYPVGINLTYYTLTTLNALTALPLTLNLGVVAASNLHMMLTFVIGGMGTFLLVRYLLGSNDDTAFGISVLAGVFYAFASYRLFYVALGQFNIASHHWVPLAILYVLKTRHQPARLKNAMLAALFLTLQAWAELTYASFIVVFIALDWLYWGLSYIRRGVLFPQLRAAFVMGLVFAAGISPILAHMLPDMLTEGDFLVEGSGFAEAFSADAFGFLIPTMHHPWLGHLITESNISNFDKGQHIYLGFVLLSLTLLSLPLIIRQAEARFWGLTAVIFGWLCLGPTIIINGESTGWTGPFVLFQELPLFRGNRYPSRYSVMLILSLSVLAAMGLYHLRRWLHNGRLRAAFLGGLAVLFLLEHVSMPLPQSDMRVPAPYDLIAADPADVAVLDIPFAWRNGFRITGALTTEFMFGQFYQTAHQKRLLQGNISRNPEFKFQYFTRAPILNSLLALETGKKIPTERGESDREIAAEVLRFFNIGYIVVRPDRSGNPIVTPQATIPYIESVLPVEKIHANERMTIYRVLETPPPADLTITTASPTAPLYFGEGWGLLTAGNPIAAQRQRVRLLLPLSERAHTISLRLRTPEIVEGSQFVRFYLNGWRTREGLVTHEWHTLDFEVPAGVASPGLNDVTVEFIRLTPLSSDPLLDITVRSAGEEVGDFGYIYVNGRQVSPNERGYNALQLDSANRRVGSFDTHLDPAASAKLAEFVSQPWHSFALAAADEASATLTAQAVEALQSLGSTVDLRGCFRCSHALIVTADGTVYEAIDALRPVGVTTNLGLTEPNIAAQLDSIRVQIP